MNKVMIAILACLFSVGAHAVKYDISDNKLWDYPECKDWAWLACQGHNGDVRSKMNAKRINQNGVRIDENALMIKQGQERARLFEKQTTDGIAALSAFSAISGQPGELTLGIGAGQWNDQTGGAMRFDYRPTSGVTLSGGFGGAGSEQIYSLGMSFRIK